MISRELIGKKKNNKKEREGKKNPLVLEKAKGLMLSNGEGAQEIVPKASFHG